MSDKLTASPLYNADLPLGLYRHYKGQDYEVRGLARHSETGEWFVFYRCLYGDFSDWIRPLAMFTEEVEYEGKRQPRFLYVGPTAELPDHG